MGGGSRGRGSTNTVVENPLPDYARPYVEEFLNRSNALSLTGYAPYTGDTYAPQNINELDGINALARRARYGSPTVIKGKTIIKNAFDGLRINANPTINNAYEKMVEAILQEFEEEELPRINNLALLTGNFGSGGHNLLQAKAAERVLKKLVDAGLDVYYKDYVLSRAEQTDMLEYGIPYGQECIRDAELLRKAGLYAREWLQGYYDDAYKKWKDIEEYKVRRLEILGNAIRAMVGAHVTKTEPLYRPSPFQTIANLAISGAMLYASIIRGGIGVAQPSLPQPPQLPQPTIIPDTPSAFV